MMSSNPSRSTSSKMARALPPSAMRMELTRIVSGRLELPESLAETLLAGGGTRAGAGGGGQGSPQGVGGATREATQGRGSGNGSSAARSAPGGVDLSRREDTERAFLALCIASPQEGAQALADLDVDEHFSSALLRRAARRLREGDLSEPMRDRPGEAGTLEDDPELKRLLAELVVEAGREHPEPAMLEVQRLQLELAMVDRLIQRARGQDNGDVSELATRKAKVKLEFDRAYSRVLEKTGDR